MTLDPPNACLALGRIADEIAAGGPSGRELLVELGYRVAGIPRGWRAWPALAAGGRTKVKGLGFRPELSDSSRGQSRHFAGTARAVTLLGDRATVWLSVNVRRDPLESPDGRLTLMAVEFASGLLDGSLSTRHSGDWIRGRLCA